VTSGVADSFENGVAYNASCLNALGEQLYTKGVVPETITTLKVTADADSQTVLIHPGMAFFADGAVMEITEGGHTLSFAPGEKHYVYLKNDLARANTCYPACEKDAPDGDFVLLAEILEDGTTKDARTYAKGKLPGYQSNGPVLKIEDVAIKEYQSTENEEVRTYEVGNNGYRFLLAVQDENGGGEGNKVLSLYSFETGSCLSCYGGFVIQPNNEIETIVDGRFHRQSGFYICHQNFPEEVLIATDISLVDGVLSFTLLKGGLRDPVPFALYLF
ncbi:MAG: hypothetical protein J6Q27_04095, partial [Clostridia bacterium]|nr:hypothetical protein [Clostridia bacterium]